MIHPAAATESPRSSVIVGKIAAIGPIAQLAMKYPRQTVVSVTNCEERPRALFRGGSDLGWCFEQRNHSLGCRANSLVRGQLRCHHRRLVPATRPRAPAKFQGPQQTSR